jgi:hypothetical protein
LEREVQSGQSHQDAAGYQHGSPAESRGPSRQGDSPGSRGDQAYGQSDANQACIEAAVFQLQPHQDGGEPKAESSQDPHCQYQAQVGGVQRAICSRVSKVHNIMTGDRQPQGATRLLYLGQAPAESPQFSFVVANLDGRNKVTRSLGDYPRPNEVRFASC